MALFPTFELSPTMASRTIQSVQTVQYVIPFDVGLPGSPVITTAAATVPVCTCLYPPLVQSADLHPSPSISVVTLFLGSQLARPSMTRVGYISAWDPAQKSLYGPRPHIFGLLSRLLTVTTSKLTPNLWSTQKVDLI